MNPLPDAARRFRFRVKTECFGLKINQILPIRHMTPNKGQIILVEINGTVRMAKYHGRHVELTDGTFTWLYKLIGTLK